MIKTPSWKPKALAYIKAPWALALLLLMASCGGGVPVRLRIDQFSMDLNLDTMLSGLADNLRATGALPQDSTGLPETWPSELPPLKERVPLSTPPAPVDLSSDGNAKNAEAFKTIDKAAGVVRRIEINQLVLLIEDSSLRMGLPALNLQVADKVDADPGDPTQWRTIGILDPTEASFQGENALRFIPSGESFINGQLLDEDKAFGMRLQGDLDIDTDVDKVLPGGQARLRLIIVATFFLDPI